jgi:LysR family transcriptional regulator, nitrogen assimilation regulatory protein
MDLKQLEYFVAVSDSGSFSRAAVMLNLAQSSLSRQVALLEEEVGQKLFERNGRGVTPTPAGNALLGHARDMLRSASAAKFQIREMGAEQTGRVLVGLPPRLAIAQSVALIGQFRQRFPRALLTIVEGLSLSLQNDLIAGRIDVALLYDPAPTPLLKMESLMRERLVLAAPASFRLPEQINLAILREFDLVLPISPNPIRKLVDGVLEPRKIALKVVAEVGGVHTALTVVESGKACSIVPESAIQSRGHSAKIKTTPIGPPAMWNHLKLAFPASRPTNKLTQETIRILRSLDFKNPGERS